MKVLIFLTIIAVALAAEYKPLPAEIEAKLKDCQTETKTTDALVKQIFLHKFDFDDESGKCYIKCSCRVTGFCDEKINLLPAPFAQKKGIPLEKASKAIESCNKLFGKDDCDTAFVRFKCFFNEVPDAPVHVQE